MSTCYSLSICLNVKYTKKNIEHILEKCSISGFLFFARREGEDPVDNTLFLDFHKALLRFFENNREKKGLSDIEESLLTKYEDTYFNLGLSKEEHGLIRLDLYNFSFMWDKKFRYGAIAYTVDFARYIRLAFYPLSALSISNIDFYSDANDCIGEKSDCITSVINMGSFEQAVSGSLKGVKGSSRGILDNAKENSFTFFDENTKQHIEPSAQKCYAILKADFPVYLYATKNDVPFKIEIKKNSVNYDFVSVYPLEPYQMKKGYGNDEKKIDVAFYVQCLIELCENFAIYELKSFL